jgi:hypothetical protein
VKRQKPEYPPLIIQPAHFPRPLPDELLFSTLCRLSELQILGNGRLVKHLGLYHGPSSRSVVNPLFPVPTSVLAQLTPRKMITEDEMIANHTLLPFLKPLVLPEFYESQLNRIRYGRVDNNSRRTSIPALQVCPICIKEDAMPLGGLPLIRRSHQIPGVLVCLKHHCWLNQVPPTNRTRYSYFHPSRLLDLSAVKGGKIPESVITLAQDLQDIPNIFRSLDAREIWRVLRWNLGKMKIRGDPECLSTTSRPTGFIVSEQTKAAFLHYATPFKEILELDRRQLRTVRIATQLERLTTPALALLYLRFCKLTPVEFVQKLQKSELQSSITRRCLNPMCSDYEKRVIPDARKRLPGTGNYLFECPTCEFAYLIPRESLALDSRHVIVYSLGKDRNEQFREFWADPRVSFRQILQTFGLTHSKTFHLARHLGLPMDRGGLSLKTIHFQRALKQIQEAEQRIEKAKKIMLNAAQKYPGLSFGKLKTATTPKIKHAAVHLTRFDPDWIQEHFGTDTRPRLPLYPPS